MQLDGVAIVDTFAEAFPMTAARAIIVVGPLGRGNLATSVAEEERRDSGFSPRCSTTETAQLSQ